MNVFFVSLGCDKNLVDSERMLGILSENGYTITQDETTADVIVINTCCFINDAKEESINTIIELGRYRLEGSCKALIVAGCLAQRYADEIRKELPEVDAVVGTMAFDHIVDVIREVLSGQEDVACMLDIDRALMPKAKRMMTTGGHYAYLKIAEGCDKCCTYCVIPSVRGRYRSFPMEDLLGEARVLAEGGVKELILVAQETTLYGVDLYGKKSLHTLIERLCAIKGLRWIRVLYCYPEEIYDELIETIRREEKCCHYLDLPIQHSSDAILHRMGRRTTNKELRERIDSIREQIPDITLRTTLITGFPGETGEEHEELLSFVREMRFDRLGVFPYSMEEGTAAARMEEQVPDPVKESRYQELMECQQDVAWELARDMIGRELIVMVEGLATEEHVYVCRTYADAPDVDGYLFLNSDEMLMTGDFVKVKVTGAYEYDLIGEFLEPC